MLMSRRSGKVAPARSSDCADLAISCCRVTRFLVHSAVSFMVAGGNLDDFLTRQFGNPATASRGAGMRFRHGATQDYSSMGGD